MGSPLLRRGRCLVGFPPSLPCALLLALVLTSSFLGAIASSRGMIRSAADVLTIPMVETPEEQGATVVIDLSGKKALEDDVSVAAIGVNANAMTDRRLTEWPVQGYAASLRVG